MEDDDVTHDAERRLAALAADDDADPALRLRADVMLREREAARRGIEKGDGWLARAERLLGEFHKEAS